MRNVLCVLYVLYVLYVIANFLNHFFSSICTPIKANSVLPSLLFKTNTRISYSRITNKDRLPITKSLGYDTRISHGYDSISMKMINICSEAVAIHSKIIFEESLKKEYFKTFGKKVMQFLYVEKNAKL